MMNRLFIYMPIFGKITFFIVYAEIIDSYFICYLFLQSNINI